MNKPITVIRQEYLQEIVNATNSCALPSVFKADVLETALRQLRANADDELKRDMEAYKKESIENDSVPFTGTIPVSEEALQAKRDEINAREKAQENKCNKDSHENN